MSYAENTSVSVEKTRVDLDMMLTAKGASQTGVVSNNETSVATVGFTMKGRQYRLEVPMPRLAEYYPKPKDMPRGWWNWTEPRRKAWGEKELDQARRSRWRAVLMSIRMKFEVVEIGLSTIEREFLADMVLADGQTMHEATAKGIEQMYLTGQMPSSNLLLGPGGT